jgi:hypothetical protein
MHEWESKFLPLLSNNCVKLDFLFTIFLVLANYESYSTQLLQINIILISYLFLPNINNDGNYLQ